MTYRTEFPDYDDDTAPAALIALGFEDTSWGNEASPCFTLYAAGLEVYADFVSHDLREFPDDGIPRFTIRACEYDASGAYVRGSEPQIIGEPDTLPDLLALLASYATGGR